MIKPIGNRLVVKVLEAVQEEKGLILIVAPTESFVRARILAVNDKETELHVGDEVILAKNTGLPCAEGLIIGKVDILAVVEA